MGNLPSFHLKLLSAYLVVHASYLLHHVLPSQSPSPWSLLGRWREYVCLYFLHVLCLPQLRLVSFFFCCLNNPCCIYKQNLRFINHRIFFSHIDATCTPSIIHLVCPSKFCYRQTIRPLESEVTIYMGKREIPVRKSNGSRHYVWEPSENMGCDLRRCQFFYSFKSVQSILIYFVAGRSPITSSSSVLCLCTRFPPGWFV